MVDKFERFKLRLVNFQTSFDNLNDACQLQTYSALELAGLIKTFEMTFELTWKTLKDLLEHEGYLEASPRAVIRTSLEANFISAEECERLLEALTNRNVLTHTYDSALAEKSMRLVKNEYYPVLSSVLQKLSGRV
ncbi:nucleotidyltransferase substrate binding protein [Shewanella sp. 202IG2-18]|uniref:HI0074 family nucleotidyltransferase substrate-binding subunit n=1 Tax=Parashewanella hymeniacidonis TaxID=2807618 RepID=UPI001960B271|nr:HI0074 family nucleotidyltransferase substrate-binding subunit [Parashewanella hymeniacidonis]MBM7072112.1 nucleotidyltransferase substrate binding protein [Parashewanella hymeniacidonis]